MALDREKILRDAERMLKQGKVQPALGEIRRVAAEAVRDLAVLNRIGDILTRHGQDAEAMLYFTKTVEEFARSGFYPKAIAVCKKIHRIQPDDPENLIRIADLYIRQKLPGEARTYLQQAADSYLKSGEFERSREVYEKLLDAEPGDPRHRMRLAEVLAAEGRRDDAGEKLLELADSLGEDPPAEQREEIYRRAADLLPARAEPVAGLVAVLSELDRDDEALAVLEQRTAKLGQPASLSAEMAVLYDRLGRGEDALALLAKTNLAEVPLQTMERFFRARVENGDAQAAWDRLESGFDQWSERDGTVLPDVLARLSRLEDPGHAPALRRLIEIHESNGDYAAVVTALERLIRVERERSNDDAVQGLQARLAEVTHALSPEPLEPASDPEPKPEPVPTVASSPEVQQFEKQQELPPPGAEANAVPMGTDAGPDDATEVPLFAEAPAIPLNRTDEEFVGGRLTQAEILDKYGLQDKAVEQLRELVGRFPGHVEAQEHLCRLLEDVADNDGMSDALVGLALARRASGDLDGAREVAGRAAATGSLGDTERTTLFKLDLLEHVEPVRGMDRSEPVADLPPPPPETSGFPVPGDESLDDEVVVDFGGGDGPEPSVEPPPAAVSTDLDAVRPDIEAAEIVDAPVTPSAIDLTGTEEPDDPIDDLSALTAALESELFAEETAPLVPEASSEQNFDEVFAAFRRHVEDQVDSTDHRTHYDLGIAYKEMGLLEEAIHEFETALPSEDLFREACIMIAMCCRDLARSAESVDWYRKALGATGGDPESSNGLRYDLADVLQQCGDLAGAIETLRHVHAADPSYRDVETLIVELENRREP